MILKKSHKKPKKTEYFKKLTLIVRHKININFKNQSTLQHLLSLPCFSRMGSVARRKHIDAPGMLLPTDLSSKWDTIMIKEKDGARTRILSQL